VRDEQIPLAQLQPTAALAVGEAAGQFDLHANELRAGELVVLVEPVGHCQPERVVVRLGE
jgi:hypothetical protein